MSPMTVLLISCITALAVIAESKSIAKSKRRVPFTFIN